MEAWPAADGEVGEAQLWCSVWQEWLGRVCRPEDNHTQLTESARSNSPPGATTCCPCFARRRCHSSGVLVASSNQGKICCCSRHRRRGSMRTPIHVSPMHPTTHPTLLKPKRHWEPCAIGHRTGSTAGQAMASSRMLKRQHHPSRFSPAKCFSCNGLQSFSRHFF